MTVTTKATTKAGAKAMTKAWAKAMTKAMTKDWKMRTGKTPVVNLDMDGVVYNMVAEYLRRFAPHTRYEQVTTWSIWERTGQTKQEFWDAFHHGVAMGLFATGAPYEGAIPAIKELDGNGVRVRFVTSKTLSKPESTRLARQDVLNWLHWHGLGRLEVVFTGGYAKQGYPADVVVDDKPTLEWTQSGALNILFDQPWNRNVALACDDVAVRAYGWDHVMELVGEWTE